MAPQILTPEEHPLKEKTDEVTGNGKADLSSGPGAYPVKTTQRKNRRLNILRTLQIYGANLGVAFSFHLLGLTLLDLRDLTNSSTERTATLFLWRGLGGLVGSLVSGKLSDKMNHQILYIAPLVITGIILAVIPWSTLFWATAMLHGLLGLLLSAPSLASNVMVVRIWEDKSAPFLQALHLLFPVSAFLSPLFTAPFLTPRHSEHKNPSNTSWKYHSTGNVSEMMSDESNGSYVNHSVVDLENPFDATSVGGRKTRIEVPYTCVATYVWLAAVPFIVQFLMNRNCRKQRREDKTNSNQGSGKVFSKAKQLCWCLFFLKACALGALENSFSGILFTYGIQALNWQTRTAAFLWTVLSACNGVGRLIGVFVSKYVPPAILLPIDYALILCALLGGAFAIHFHPTLPYVFTGVYGLGVATVFASSLSWAGSFVTLSGAFTSIYVVGYSVGSLGGPALTALLFEKLSHAWYWYILLIFASAITLIYVILLFMKRLSGGYSETTDINSVEDMPGELSDTRSGLIYKPSERDHEQKVPLT